MPAATNQNHNSFRLADLTLVGLYCGAFALCGWLVLIANLFHLDDNSTWLFPTVDDLPGLIASILVLAIIALLPYALRQLFRKPAAPQSSTDRAS